MGMLDVMARFASPAPPEPEPDPDPRVERLKQLYSWGTIDLAQLQEGLDRIFFPPKSKPIPKRFQRRLSTAEHISLAGQAFEGTINALIGR